MGMTKITIRKAQVTDAARLAKLSEVLGYPVEPELMKRRLERLLSRPDHVVLVAESQIDAGWWAGPMQLSKTFWKSGALARSWVWSWLRISVAMA